MDTFTPDFTGANTKAEKWERVRYAAEMMLRATDWTQLPDAELDAGEVSSWATYRHQVRLIYKDVLTGSPKIFTNPEDVVMPSIP